jgi:hypothetical protein
MTMSTLQEGLSQCGDSSRKRARSAGLAPDQKVQVALPSGLSGLNERSGILTPWSGSRLLARHRAIGGTSQSRTLNNSIGW